MLFLLDISQTVEYNKEMTNRLGIPFDVLSDAKIRIKKCSKSTNFFNKKNKIYLKRLTLIIEKKMLKKFFILYIQ